MCKNERVSTTPSNRKVNNHKDYQQKESSAYMYANYKS